MRRVRIPVAAAAVLATAATMWAQAAGDPSVVQVSARAAAALARLEFKVNQRIISSQDANGQAICIDKEKGLFMTQDIPGGLPEGEILDIRLVPSEEPNKSIKAKLMGTDPELNITFLKAEGPHGWGDLKFTASSQLALGDRVISVGMLGPGSGNATYLGIALVGAKLRLPNEVIYVTGGDLTNAGSPVLTPDGRAVGIVGGQLPMMARMWQGGRVFDVQLAEQQSARFFLPTEEFAHILSQIPSNPQDVRKLPWIGVLRFAAISREEGDILGTKDKPAVKVDMLYPDCAAMKAGLKEGDAIIGIDGKPLPEMPTPQLVQGNLERTLLRRAVGESVKLTVWREGKAQEYSLTLEALPPRPGDVPRYYDARLGFVARDLTVLDRYSKAGQPLMDKGVAVILPMRQNSAAALGGLLPGDLIVAVERKDVPDIATMDEVMKEMLGAGKSELAFRVKRQDSFSSLTIKVPSEP